MLSISNRLIFLILNTDVLYMNTSDSIKHIIMTVSLLRTFVQNTSTLCHTTYLIKIVGVLKFNTFVCILRIIFIYSGFFKYFQAHSYSMLKMSKIDDGHHSTLRTSNFKYYTRFLKIQLNNVTKTY